MRVTVIMGSGGVTATMIKNPRTSRTIGRSTRA